MALTGTDLYGSTYTQLAGIVRAGEASIVFTDGDDATQELAALNVAFQYSQKIQLEHLTGGKQLVIVMPSQGALTIGALLGTGLASFLSSYSDVCSMNGNELTVVMEADLTCSSPTLAAAISAYESSTLTLHTVLINDFGVSNNVRGYLVQSNLRLFVLNAEWTAA